MVGDSTVDMDCVNYKNPYTIRILATSIFARARAIKMYSPYSTSCTGAAPLSGLKNKRITITKQWHLSIM